MSKHGVIRVGDIVRVASPVMPVLRVGYALHWSEVSIEGFEDLVAIDRLVSKCNVDTRHRVSEALHREVVWRKGFGGRERVIVRDLEADMIRAGEYRVVEKTRKMLGTYNPPSPSYSWGAEYQPGYISDAKVVHLLGIEPINGAFLVPKIIASTDCEKVSE